MATRVERFIRHLWVLSIEDLRELLIRRRALLSLAVYLTVICVVVFGLAYTERRLFPTMNFFRVDNEHRSHFRSLFISRGYGQEFEMLLKTAQLPSAVVIMQIFSLLWFPTLVALLSSDMVSLDVYRKTLRYIILRTSRVTYYLSKMLGHVIFYLALQILTVSTLFAVCALNPVGFSRGQYLAALLRCLLVFTPFLWFLVASTQLISCWTARPAAAVLRMHLLWIAFIVLLYAAPSLSPINVYTVRGLISPFGAYAWESCARMALWAGFFTLLGCVSLDRKSL